MIAYPEEGFGNLKVLSNGKSAAVKLDAKNNSSLFNFATSKDGGAAMFVSPDIGPDTPQGNVLSSGHILMANARTGKVLDQKYTGDHPHSAKFIDDNHVLISFSSKLVLRDISTGIDTDVWDINNTGGPIYWDRPNSGRWTSRMNTDKAGGQKYGYGYIAPRFMCQGSAPSKRSGGHAQQAE